MERKEKEEQGYWKGRRKWRRGNKDNGKKGFKKWKKEKEKQGLWKGRRRKNEDYGKEEKEEQG